MREHEVAPLRARSPCSCLALIAIAAALYCAGGCVQKSAVVLGPAAGFASQYPEIADTGGLLCQLPVSEDGDAVNGLKNAPQEGSSSLWGTLNEPASGGMLGTTSDRYHAAMARRAVRKVLVCCAMDCDENGQIMPLLQLIPVEPPRRAAYCPPGGTGAFAGLPSLGALLRARERSPLHLKAQTLLDGRPCWVVTAPRWPAGTSELSPSELDAEVYFVSPDSGAGAMPAEVFRIAERTAGGSWQPKLDSQAPFAVEVVMKNGKPAGLKVTQQIKEIPIESF